MPATIKLLRYRCHIALSFGPHADGNDAVAGLLESRPLP